MKRILFNNEADEILANVGSNKAKLVYLDPPFYYEGNFIEYFQYLELILIKSREILSQDGFLVINSQRELRAEIQVLVKQILGKDSFFSEIINISSRPNHLLHSLADCNEHLLIFGRSKLSKIYPIYEPLNLEEQRRYKNPDHDPKGPYMKMTVTINTSNPNLKYEFCGVFPKFNRGWRYSRSKMDELLKEGRLLKQGESIFLKRYLSEIPGKQVTNIWNCQLSSSEAKGSRVAQQPISLHSRLIEALTNKDDLIVDPYCGSGTSLIASIEKKRRWHGGDNSMEAIDFIFNRLDENGFAKKVNFIPFNKNSNNIHNYFVPKITRKMLHLIADECSVHSKVNEISSVKFERTLVIIVSVEEYADFGGNTIPKVKYANRDASLFRNTLIKYWGVDENDIYEFKNNQAFKSSLEYEIYGLINNIKENERFIFYYAGHGFHDGTSNRISTYDTHPGNLFNTSISLRELIIDPIIQSKCTSALFFIDSCAQKISNDLSRRLLKNIDLEEFKLLTNENSHYATYLSCSTGQSSYSCDELQHGVWTYHLCAAFDLFLDEVIRGGEIVTDRSLSTYLSKHVSSYIAKKLNYEQSPKAILESSHENLLVKIRPKDS
ncbi:DNA methyltransferase [Vibrio ouci]|uniref:site-specific DNA-methyltransferase (adenine-specific) n=1 Tax=Vibrio ouci TaxID=2499078 RepID=A0A4Y8W8H9_9VIBR|nr:DNA methyltransferase [Vibrio ouci]TFH89240.1 site-specific DNA-methyltransferase [Vibrio ouci]